MSKFKKCLALLLVLTFAIALVACDGGSQGESNTTKATTLAQADETTVVGETTAGQQTKTDKNGKVVTTTTKSSTTEDLRNVFGNDPTGSTIPPLIARTTNRQGNASDKFVKSLKGFTLKLFYPWENIYATKQGEKAAKAAMKAVQEAFGAKIVDKGKFNNYNESLAAMLASRSCDSHIYYVQNYNFASWFQKGYLSNLNTAMRDSGVDFGDPWYLSSAKGFLNINGYQYGWIPYEDEYTMPFSIIYNKNLLSKKKLTDPAKLAKSGKWTWSTLESYAKKFANDKSVTGFCASHTSQLLASLANQNGTSLCKVSRGAQPNTNIGDSKLKNSLTTLGAWCTGKKAWVETFSNQSWTYAKNQLAEGKVAMYFGTHDDIKSLSGAKSGDNYGIVPFPTKNGSKSYTNVAEPQFICFIPTQYQKQSAKILFLRNEYYRQNYRFAARNFQYTWKQFFKDGNVLNDACNIKYARNGNKTVFNWVSVCEDNSAKVSTNMVISYVISGKGSAATAISKFKSSLTTAYSDVWKGYKITGKV